MDAERRPHRERLDELLEDPVGQELHDDHPARGLGPGSAQGEQHRERRCGPGAQVRDVSADEGDGRDRADQRNAEDEGAERHDRRVECGDKGHAQEVAPQRAKRSLADDMGDRAGHSEVPFGPVADLRVRRSGGRTG